MRPPVRTTSANLADRLWRDFTIHDNDLLVEKSTPSAFFPGRCALPEMLAHRGIDTVLITGTVTNVCCESSARDASTLGLRVIMIADSNAARRDATKTTTPLCTPSIGHSEMCVPPPT